MAVHLVLHNFHTCYMLFFECYQTLPNLKSNKNNN